VTVTGLVESISIRRLAANLRTHHLLRPAIGDPTYDTAPVATCTFSTRSPLLGIP
jgi:hypothetical protein